MAPFDELHIPYGVRRSKRAKHLRIEIHAGGEIRCILPQKMNMKSLRQFLLQRKDWILQSVREMQKLPKPKSETEIKKEYQQYRELARKIILRKIQYFNSFYNFSIGRVSIRRQKTCWGSCSQKKNLNFNYRIIFLPEHLSNYIIVHELCHLREFNHSEAFWKLVAKMIPNYQELKKQLHHIHHL